MLSYNTRLYILLLTEQKLNTLFMTGSEYFKFAPHYCISVDKFSGIHVN